MRSTTILAGLLGLAQWVSGTPTPTVDEPLEARAIVKRATITDTPTVGYATTNGGTTGGKGGTVTTVSTLAQFTAAVNEKDTTARVVVVSGTITGAQQIRIGSNKTVIGLPGAKFVGISLFIWKQANVIVRNIISQNVLASTGDALTIQKSTNVWVDHCEFYSQLVSDKDYYDGLVDVTHASEWVTISNTYFHDHWKTSLVGHSDNNAAEDTGHLHVTYANNYWLNIGSRAPSLRFGTGHIFNSYYKNVNTAIDPRDGAQVLVQSNVFVNVTEPLASLYSDDVGYAVATDNDFGGASNEAPAGTLTTVPYSYTLLGSKNVVAAVVGVAGATLKF
ncbi:pectate lyase [Phlyctema vagabunda]|uniref:Pectate lyase n=1 Tax=Phlyctema vagabunda TaxID=108571 RepID=A0ABR4P632_9HELO